MRFSLRLILALSPLVAVLGGCSGSHDKSGDAGGDAGVDVDATVIITCGGIPLVGEPCSFTEPCVVHSDFWMGYCGNERWECVAGRVVYTDLRWPCELDLGIDARFDAGTASTCADYVAPPAATTTDCRSDAECVAWGGCWAPGDTTPFYAGGACPRECAGDADCVGGVCRLTNGGACGLCVSACVPGSCSLWEVCGSDGHCAPARCESGAYACPPGAVCGGPGASFDAHGCVLVLCSSDADCGCGACVRGVCASGPGRCDLPRP